jgi:hypothetical protein
MRLKITSDGPTHTTRLVNAETGEPIGVVKNIRIRIGMDLPMVEALVEFSGMELDLVADATFVNQKPDLSAFKPEPHTHPGKANAIPPPPSEATFPKEAITKPTPKPGRYLQAEGALSAEEVPTGIPLGKSEKT